MRYFKSVVAVTLAASVALGVGLHLASGQDKKDAPAKDKDKVPAEPSVGLAAQAAQLALEGQKRKSPTLMLAAVELLGGLKEGGGKLKDVKTQTEGDATKTEKKPLAMNVGDWVDLAKEYAKDDKELSAFLEKRLEQLGKRGLIYSQGVGLPSIEVRGTTFKVIETGVISPGQTRIISNAIFEPNKPAVVAVVGDGDGDLDLWVYGPTGNQIGADTDSTSFCVVRWLPSAQYAVTIKVKNVGRVAERYIILANW